MNVVKGYCQEEGIDYEEMFSHIVRLESVCIFLAYTEHKNFDVFKWTLNVCF